MIKKIVLAILWCICIIFGLKALALAFSETVGIVVIICILAIVDVALRYVNRHNRWFRKRVNILRTICPKSPNDFRMNGDPLYEPFYSNNFYLQFKPETKEFKFCCCTYIILPNYAATWNKAIEGIKALIEKETPDTKIATNTQGELGRDFNLTISPKDAKKELLLDIARILIRLNKSLPYRTNENGILSCGVYFKIKVFDTICYGEYNGVRVSKAITISSDGNYCLANGEEEECYPEDFAKSNPSMSIILQYDLNMIESKMLVSKEEFDVHWKKGKSLCES